MSSLWQQLKDEEDSDKRYDLYQERKKEQQTELSRAACCAFGYKFLSIMASPYAVRVERPSQIHAAEEEQLRIQDEGGLILPQWVTFSITEYRQNGYPVVCSFCPFCGDTLPDFKTRETPPEHIHHSTDGYYCDTCADRNQNCYCSFPETRWEPDKREWTAERLASLAKEWDEP